MTPQQSNLNDINAIINAGNWTASICSELCRLVGVAKDNEWWDNWQIGCSAYGNHCKVEYGPCDACEVTD